MSESTNSLAQMNLAQTRQWLELLLAGESLQESDAAAVMMSLTDPNHPPALAGALLGALRAKGVTAAELRGFAGAMLSLARRLNLSKTKLQQAIDIVGTGGDASGSFNLSTGAALLAAACGQPVTKHGNRSISSRSGSADVLESLGLSLPLDEQTASECLDALNFTFFFAPYYDTWTCTNSFSTHCETLKSNLEIARLQLRLKSSHHYHSSGFVVNLDERDVMKCCSSNEREHGVRDARESVVASHSWCRRRTLEHVDRSRVRGVDSHGKV